MSGRTMVAKETPGLGRFRDDLANHYGPHDVCYDDHPGARCRLDFLNLGPFGVGIATGAAVQWQRSHGKLADVWQDKILLVQQRTGQSVVDHFGRSVTLHTHDMMLTDSIGPCRFRLQGEGTLVCFDLPRSWFERNLLSNDMALARRLDGSSGIGRLLSTMITTVTQYGEEFDAFDRDVVMESAQSLLIRSLRNSSDISTTVFNDRTVAILRKWAQDNLEDPDITPVEMAQACGLSRRQLYRVFAAYGLTPSAWLWQVRLEAAHALLRERSDLRVTEVAFAVGFNDASHFSRLFKNQFGISPRQLRTN